MALPEAMNPLELIQKCVDGYFALLPRPKPSLEQLSQTCLIAHRGAHDKSKNIIENTLEAFERAHRLGCFGIELDIQCTKDGVLVVHHDPCLKRLWNKKISIADLSFSELQKIIPNIPSLEEVVAGYGKKLHLFIELKTPFNSEKNLKKVLYALSPKEDYHLISLDEHIFSSFSLFERELLLLVPVHNNVQAFCKLSLKKPYGGILGHYLLFKNSLVQQIKDAGQQAGVGLVNSAFNFYREIHRGIPWIFSDNVGLLSEYLTNKSRSDK